MSALEPIGAIRKVGRNISAPAEALNTLGVDATYLVQAAAAMQMIGASANLYKGLVGAYQTVTAIKGVEASMHLAKYGWGAVAVAGIAAATGYAFGEIMERTANGQRDMSSVAGSI